MNIDLAALPDDVDTLQRMVRTLATERANLTEAQAEIERLRLIVQKLQRSQFGRRAERQDDDQLQFGFEDLHADIARVEATLPSTTVKAPRSRPDRPSLPAHLPREDMRLDLEHHATIDPGPGPNRRPPSTSTVLIARQSVLPLISRTSVVCCKSTAMLASSG
jgi:transposase